MRHPILVALLWSSALGLAGCGDGNPFFEIGLDTDGDGIPDEDEPDSDGDGIPDDDDPDSGTGGFEDTGGIGAIPVTVSGNLTEVNYNPENDTVTVQIASLDTTPVEARYRRNEDLDIRGYRAYSVQEDPLDRMFIALVQTARDGSTEGGVVMDGGQFNRFFGGAFYRRIGDYEPFAPSQPDNGLVSYAGRYAGLTNIDAPRPGEILPVPPGTAVGNIPGQPSRVSGEIFINADFADETINGAVTNREIVDTGLALADVILIATDIQSNGSFVGTVEDPGLNTIGDYAGAFGGDGATSLSGGLSIDDYLENIENEFEYGTFVLMQCGQVGDAAICDDVDPPN
jgi:hypothetical protein